MEQYREIFLSQQEAISVVIPRAILACYLDTAMHMNDTKHMKGMVVYTCIHTPNDGINLQVFP